MFLTMSGSMQNRIEEKLKSAFSPTYLEVVNESHLHKGHAGDDGSGESHFAVTIISDYFKNMGHVQKQRSIYSELKDEMKSIHALSLKVQTEG